MKVLILGGGGMIGQRLAASIATGGVCGEMPTQLILHDLFMPPTPDTTVPVTALAGDASDPQELTRLAGVQPDLIFHLAAVVSGEAEEDFEKGWRVNARGGWGFLDTLRAQHMASNKCYRPKVVFASSIAVFGGPYPETLLDDEFLTSPQSSYGAQKAVMELLVQDYSRKGFIDGMSLRLPTICVRPGNPNKAASSFFSGIVREPLNGEMAILPVSDTIRHWFASPRSAVNYLLHAAALDTGLLDNRRSLNLPGVSCTIAEQIEALRAIAGEAPVKLIRYQPDPDIQRIVGGWPEGFTAERATRLGFSADRNFEDIVRVYMEEELGKQAT